MKPHQANVYPLNRRRFLIKILQNGVLLQGVLAVPLVGCTRKPSESDGDVIDSAIEELPDGKQLIFESHELAQQMHYFHDHSKVDRTRFQSKTDSQMCVNCEYFTPLKGAKKYGDCAYIKGDKWVVHSQGWCTKFKHKQDG